MRTASVGTHSDRWRAVDADAAAALRRDSALAKLIGRAKNAIRYSEHLTDDGPTRRNSAVRP